MRNQIPTHKAIPIKGVGEIERCAAYAQAILTLIQNDGSDSENLEGGAFYTNENIIRTALSAVSDYLSQIQAAQKTGYYLVDSRKETSNEN